jgi:hypothetical protein
MNNSRNRYEIFSQIDSDKFMDFIIDLFDNMGMKREGRGMDLPIQCGYCPFYKECQAYEDDDTTCLEFRLTRLR